MRWAVVQLALWMGAILAAPPAATAPRPFELRDGQVVISVTLNGRDVSALLDTGATRSLIDADFARTLGIRSQRVGGGTIGASGKTVRLGFTDPVMVDIGAGARRRKLGTYQATEPFAPDGVHILIGMDALDNLAVSIDFDTMTINIDRAAGLTPPDSEPFKLKRIHYLRPTLSVALGETKVELVIDTAASGELHLQTGVVTRSAQLSALPTTRRRITGIDGEHERDAIVIPSVNFGGRTFTDVRASMAEMPLIGAPNMHGVIGVDLMEHFHLAFDFARDFVWMTPRVSQPGSSAP